MAADMKILFVWRKMDMVAGGVERMVTAMMNEMIRREHEVSLLTWDRKGAKSYYNMDDRIKWHCLDMGDPMAVADWALRWQRMRTVREIVRKDRPDVMICFESGIFLSMKLFLLGYGIPMIAAERNAPSRLDFMDSASKKNFVFQALRLARYITVQFERYREGYPPYLRRKITVIHNPVYPAKEYASPGGEGARVKILLCVGRLAYQKNIDVLIEAFSKLTEDFPDWQLVIAGAGEDEQKLKKMISAYDMEEKITLSGAVGDVAGLYRSAQLFCLPSRWEGFPNALAEALAYGLPSVGFAGCSGVCDLIDDGINGLLAAGNGDVDSLAQTLRLLMGDGARRVRMGKAAVLSMAPYEPEQIFDQWENFFQSVSRA